MTYAIDKSTDVTIRMSRETWALFKSDLDLVREVEIQNNLLRLHAENIMSLVKARDYWRNLVLDPMNREGSANPLMDQTSRYHKKG